MNGTAGWGFPGSIQAGYYGVFRGDRVKGSKKKSFEISCSLVAEHLLWEDLKVSHWQHLQEGLEKALVLYYQGSRTVSVWVNMDYICVSRKSLTLLSLPYRRWHWECLWRWFWQWPGDRSDRCLSWECRGDADWFPGLPDCGAGSRGRCTDWP